MSTSTATPSTWTQIWENAQPRLYSIQQSLVEKTSPSSKVIRVGQLDAELLDQELVQLLQEPLTKALALVNSAFKGRFHAELTLLIQLTLYKFSVWDSGASYGAKLQGLRYSQLNRSSDVSRSVSRLPLRVLCFHGALTILVPYIHSRIRAHALSNAWPDAPSSDKRRKAWDLLTRLESTHAFLGLLNFIAFLWDGRFRTVSDRLLSLRLVPARRLSKHDVSYEFMNRQMVWHAFTEFLLFLLPLINTRALRRWLSRAFAQMSFSSILPAPIRSLVGVTPDSQSQRGAQEHRGKYWSLPLDQCAICAEDAATAMNLADPSKTLTSLANNYSTVSVPTEPPIESDNVEEEPPPYPIYNPYFASCGHSYCYVCLAGRMMRAADDRTGVGPGGTRWECLRCGDGVTVVDRVETEVEEVESDFGSTSMNGMDYEEYGSEDMEFTDMSGSMGTYSDSGASE